MIRSSKLLAVLTALCLLFSLIGGAETVAEPNTWPQELIGAWVGYDRNFKLWIQYTFYPDGRYQTMAFEAPYQNRSGTVSSIPADDITVQGDLMRLTLDGVTSDFQRAKSPYYRAKEADETPTKYVDPEIVGTFGGTWNGTYMEWTFYGDGRFTQVKPGEMLERDGCFFSIGGKLDIRVNGQSIKCAYGRSTNALRLELPGREVRFFARKPGKLEKMTVNGGFGWTFEQEAPRGWAVRQYFGSEIEVSIPDEAALIAVVGICDEAFRGNLTVKSVTAGSITRIGSFAFEGCKSIESVVIPDSVTWIGEGAFDNCPALTLKVNEGSYAKQYAQDKGIPFEIVPAAEEQTSMDDGFEWAFTEDEKPEGFVVKRYHGDRSEVGIPGVVAFSAVVSIGDEAFKTNKNLVNLTIPAFVDRIGKAAFENCDSLESVMLIGTDTGNMYEKYDPDSYKIAGVSVIRGSCPLKTIGENAFRGCVSLKDLAIADSASQSPYSIYWWIGHSDRSGVNIPNGMTTIGAHAFDGCVSIQSMTIPDSVTQIGEGAFDNCPALTLKASEGSFALKYAQDNGIPFEITGK